jgi:hypothetical protein
MKILRLGGLGVAAITMLACHSIPESDARGALQVAENAAKIADSGKRMREIYAGCGSLASCASGCERALENTVDDSQRGMLIARCFKGFEKAKTADPKLTADGWFLGYFDDYLGRAREKLPSAEQARLDAARKKLGPAK